MCQEHSYVNSLVKLPETAQHCCTRHFSCSV